jgi:pyrroloquinoline quinone biosynthesis protein B
MRILVLGSAAGGGFPQWNCNCRMCRAARDPTAAARPRTQSSIAVRGARGPWILCNASPDLRAQLEQLPADRNDGMRSTPVAGVVLTDAEIDHTAGLMLLRESSEPIHIYSSDGVRRALTAHYPVLPILERYCGTIWTRIDNGQTVDLAGSSLEVESFPTGGDAPLYMDDDADGPASVGVTIRDRDSGRTLTYAPALAALDDEIAERFAASDCVLVDGTFWENDELVELGIATRDAHAMGHAPLAGPDGTLAKLALLGPRRILVHVNNTNPILFDDSNERATVEETGVEVAYDGMEIEL